MSYCVNLGVWGSVFAVPSSVVDKHIKLVGSAQLKVLLWILRNSDKEFSEEDISSSLSIHKEDVKDSINYWMETGILNCKENFSPCTQESLDKPDKKDEKTDKLKDRKTDKSIIDKPRALSRVLKPDSSYIAERVKGSEEIAYLMQEAQVILGRPISPGDSAVLLMLLDNEGLPIDVILMIIQYAVGIGKGSMRYIEAVGVSWAKEEIDTVEKADKKIQSLSEVMKAWRNFQNIIGVEKRQPSSSEEEAVYRWQRIWNYDTEMLKEAYDICINYNGKYVLKYIDRIITRWHKLGITTIEQVHKDSNSSSKINKAEDEKPSYSISRYESYDILDEINWGLKRMAGKNES